MAKTFLVSILLCFLLVPFRSSAQPVLFEDVVFAEVGGRPLLLDLTLPGPADPVNPYPLAIYVHGGGWKGGTFKRPAPARLLLLQRGIAIANIQYRLTTQEADFGGESVVYPAQIHDVKGAIRFLRARAADFSIDPERFAVFGTSAGGASRTSRRDGGERTAP